MTKMYQEDKQSAINNFVASLKRDGIPSSVNQLKEMYRVAIMSVEFHDTIPNLHATLFKKEFELDKDIIRQQIPDLSVTEGILFDFLLNENNGSLIFQILKEASLNNLQSRVYHYKVFLIFLHEITYWIYGNRTGVKKNSSYMMRCIYGLIDNLNSKDVFGRNIWINAISMIKNDCIHRNIINLLATPWEQIMNDNVIKHIYKKCKTFFSSKTQNLTSQKVLKEIHHPDRIHH